MPSSEFQIDAIQASVDVKGGGFVMCTKRFRAIEEGRVVAIAIGEVIFDPIPFLLRQMAITACHGKGKLVPALDSPDYPAHLMFMNYAEGTLAADVVADYRVARATTGKAPRGAETDGQRAMHYANDFLGKHPWFGGAEFSAVAFVVQRSNRIAPAENASHIRARSKIVRPISHARGSETHRLRQ